jgi:hypothetical protein
VALVFWHSNLSAAGPNATGTPRLVAMVVRVEQPLDPRDPDLMEMLKHITRTSINEQAAVPVNHAVNVAGIAPAVHTV